jgi:hypothetical protein
MYATDQPTNRPYKMIDECARPPMTDVREEVKKNGIT